MIIRTLLFFAILAPSLLAQKEILEDPEFKKKSKHWYLRKGKE